MTVVVPRIIFSPEQLGSPLSRIGRMATKLEKPLKRELSIDGAPYILTISPEGLKLTEKGRRKGLELSWKHLISGEAALATALRASLQESPPPPRPPTPQAGGSPAEG